MFVPWFKTTSLRNLSISLNKLACFLLNIMILFSASKLYVYFDLVADKINSVHRKGGIMIIYCRAGMSRYETKKNVYCGDLNNKLVWY